MASAICRCSARRSDCLYSSSQPRSSHRRPSKMEVSEASVLPNHRCFYDKVCLKTLHNQQTPASLQKQTCSPLAFTQMIFIAKTIQFSKPIHEREGTKHGETRSNHPANTATRASAAKMDKNTPKPLHNTHNHHSLAKHRRSQHSQSLRSPIEALRNLTRSPLQSRNQPD